MPDAKQCSVTLPIGAARTLRCRARSVLTLVTRDKDGNTCTKGGARVEVAARAVGSVQPGQVVDNGNGTYGLVLELDVEGDWEITATVDGTPAAGMPIKVHAAYEPITAAECELGEIDLKAALTAGQSSKLIVQVRAAAAGHTVDAVMMRMPQWDGAWHGHPCPSNTLTSACTTELSLPGFISHPWNDHHPSVRMHLRK